MEMNNWIELLFFLVAVLSALYARWAAMAARRQNEIAIHNEKLKIFKAFLDFHSKLTAYGADVSETDLYLELFPQVQLSEFYYSGVVHVELKKFFDSVSEMIALREAVVSSKDKDIISKKHSQLNVCRTSAKQVEDLMKSELRLIITRQWLLARLVA